jgi:hypothetical protein
VVLPAAAAAAVSAGETPHMYRPLFFYVVMEFIELLCWAILACCGFKRYSILVRWIWYRFQCSSSVFDFYALRVLCACASPTTIDPKVTCCTSTCCCYLAAVHVTLCCKLPLAQPVAKYHALLLSPLVLCRAALTTRMACLSPSSSSSRPSSANLITMGSNSSRPAGTPVHTKQQQQQQQQHVLALQPTALALLVCLCWCFMVLVLVCCPTLGWP